MCFYRAANAIFGKVGRVASEEIALQLIKSKCLPILLYCLEVCPLTKNDLNSLDFVRNRFFLLNSLKPVTLISLKRANPYSLLIYLASLLKNC